MVALSVTLSLGQAQTPPWNATSIFQRSLQVSPASTSALQAVTQAQEHVAEINAQRRMQLTFSGSASANRGTESMPPTSASFSTFQGTVSLPLPNGRRISAQELQAQAQLGVAQAGLARARLDLAFQASDAYLGVLRARGAEQIAQQTLDQAERQVADAQKRVSAGDLAQSEVLKAQVPEAAAKAALARAKSTVRISEETLNSLVRSDLTAVPSVADIGTLPTLDLTLDQAHSEASTNSPDVLEAEANVTSAQAAVAIARRSLDTDLTLQASQTHTTDPTTYSNLSTLNLSFNFPLTDGGVAKRQINQALSQLRQAQASRDIVYQTLDLAVEQAYLEVQTDLANLDSTRETLRIAEESYQKAEQAYSAGLTTTRDVLDAGVALAQARSDVNSATYDLVLARAKLDQVIGRQPKL